MPFSCIGYRFTAFMPRNLTKSASNFHFDACLLPHFWAISHIRSAIWRPVSSALSRNPHPKASRIFSNMLEIVASRRWLRIRSTHLTVKSMIARSVLDRVWNQIFILKALDLTLSKSCLEINCGLPLFASPPIYHRA